MTTINDLFSREVANQIKTEHNEQERTQKGSNLIGLIERGYVAITGRDSSGNLLYSTTEKAKIEMLRTRWA